MKEYDAYIHTNGSLQVKAKPFAESFIDPSSPMVKKYLVVINARSYEEAVDVFTEMFIDLESSEFELKFCEHCWAMTNHKNGICGKCKK